MTGQSFGGTIGGWPRTCGRAVTRTRATSAGGAAPSIPRPSSSTTCANGSPTSGSSPASGTAWLCPWLTRPPTTSSPGSCSTSSRTLRPRSPRCTVSRGREPRSLRTSGTTPTACRCCAPFWDAAVRLDPAAAELDEALRFPLCHPDRLRALFAGAGLGEVATRELVVPTVFADFDDYWTPFLSGQGPAPGYCASLPPAALERLRARLGTMLGTRFAPDGGPIRLTARAWAIRGTSPG